MTKTNQTHINVVQTSITDLLPADYNPRKHDEQAADQLKQSIQTFGLVDPIIVNSAPKRKNIIIGGHFRWEMAKELGHTTVPVVYVDIPDLTKEKELNLRLNKNTGEFDWDLLAQFDESFLTQVGFSSEELDTIFETDIVPEEFNLKKELEKLDINSVKTKKGDIYLVSII